MSPLFAPPNRSLNPDVGSMDLPLEQESMSEETYPRKILLFYQDFGAMGGLERYLLQVSRLLVEQPDFQPVVVCSQDGPLYRQLKRLGIMVHGLDRPAFFSQSFWRSFDFIGLMRLIKILNREKPDLIHVHIGLLENVLLRWLGYPVLYTFHGYGSLFSAAGVTHPLKRGFKWLTQQCFRYVSSRMDGLLIVSETEKQRLETEGYLPANNTAQVLHNGLDIDDWQARVLAVDPNGIRQQWGIPEHAQCVVYFNRLDANKNPGHFVELARQLTAQAEQFKRSIPFFIMAGDGPLAETMQAESADLPNFRFLGHCEQIPALLSIATVMVHPASREGFGLGVVEAMAAGVPVVAYDCGGPQEILNTTETRHLLVPLHDLPAMAEVVSRLLDEAGSKSQTDLKSILQHRAEDFDQRHFKDGLLRVYDRLLPSVSIILPAFNGEKTILRAVQSVLNQSYAHWELIIVDDGSTDQTLSLLNTIQDERIRVFSQENQGVATARNFAFQQSRGDWIAFIDADDAWLPNKLAVEMEIVHKNTSPAQSECLVYSGYFAVNDRNKLIHLPPINRRDGDLSQAVLEEEGVFLPSTTLLHRHIFQAVGGFRPGCYHEDRVFFIEACRQFPAFSTGKRLVMYQQSMSGRCRSVLADYELALQAELSITESLRDVISVEEHRRLVNLQKRNLLYRFLMYNYHAHAHRLAASINARLPNALRVHQEEDGHTLPEANLWQGRKGLLAKISLTSGINFLYAARLLVQGCIETLIAPFWGWWVKHSLLDFYSPSN